MARRAYWKMIHPGRIRIDSRRPLR